MNKIISATKLLLIPVVVKKKKKKKKNDSVFGCRMIRSMPRQRTVITRYIIDD